MAVTVAVKSARLPGEPLEGFGQVAISEVRVPLHHAQAFPATELLHREQGHALHHEARGERMPQVMPMR